jgi:phage N-6-adenine-methyltransferase
MSTRRDGGLAGTRLGAMGMVRADDWETPPEVFGPLDREFGFTLDVAASAANAKCAAFLTTDDDGLVADWGANVCWCNPPYGAIIGRWVRKAWLASKYGATVVMLVPARTDTAWWHDYAIKGDVRFLRGRVYFLRRGQSITNLRQQRRQVRPDDGETARAQMAATIWAGLTAAERVKLKTPAALLPVVDDLLKRSIQLGSPYTSDSPDVVLVDPTPFAAVRFREWLSRQTDAVRSLYSTPAA